MLLYSPSFDFRAGEFGPVVYRINFMLTRKSLFAFICFCISFQAAAAPLGFAAARQGSILYSTGGAIAKVVKQTADIDLRMRSHQSTTQYMPLVDSGEMAFGLANTLELQFAYQGVKLFEGKPHTNLRTVGVVFPTRIADIPAFS